MGRLLLAAGAIAAVITVAAPATAAPKRAAVSSDYVVLYDAHASLAAARIAVRAAGGTLVRENQRIGVATATSFSPTFAADLLRQTAIAGLARNKPVGFKAPGDRRKRDTVERLTAAERAAASAAVKASGSPPAAEPLGGLQWDMAMIRATPEGSYRVQPGDGRVRVGVIDTGVDGNHPDIAPNFDAALSRNFTVDIPLVDGPCDAEPDHSCNDPANVDENSHGTHVAGTIASPINGLGMAGVAPSVRLVNLRAGQDSGYFFLQPSVDALTYAADNGVDVVNMSYFIDPWLFNCASNPADSPAAQLEQRTIIEATNRALAYARKNGVTLIAAAGNEHTDLDNPTTDTISPDFPPGAEYPRTVNNGCLVLPTEGPDVVSVGSVGPSTMKADYSNWGAVHIDVTAPGGYFRDLLGTPQHRTVATQILGPYPLNVAIERAPGPPKGRADAPAAPDGEDPRAHGDAAPVPESAGARLHERRAAGLVHGNVHGHGVRQQHLGARNRRRADCRHGQERLGRSSAQGHVRGATPDMSFACSRSKDCACGFHRSRRPATFAIPTPRERVRDAPRA